MSPFALQIRTLISATWRATYANPQLLVWGLFLSVLILASAPSFSALQTQVLQHGLSQLFSVFPPLLLLLLLPILLFQTLATSQIFLLSAADFLRRADLLYPRSRFTGALVYTSIEVLHALLILLALTLLFLPTLLQLEPASPLFFVVASLSLALFLMISVTSLIIKRLALGYLLLSPISLPSSFSLAWKIFLRYPYFSLLTFFLLLFVALLFTILENLVMLQSEFIGRYFSETASSGFVYTALLLANTFMSIFLEVFWLHFFLILTHKNRQVTVPALPLPRKELEECTPLPS